ncbi:MAG: hypothetical protein ACXWQR_00520 [Ktedonobacterales bacterium]
MSNINPSVVSDWELSDIQGAVSTLFDKTCVIKRATDATAATGFTTQTFATLATTKCRMGVPTGSYMQMLAERMSDLKTWLVTLPANTDVQQTDQLVIDGQTLTVQTVFAPQSYSSATRVFASVLA